MSSEWIVSCNLFPPLSKPVLLLSRPEIGSMGSDLLPLPHRHFSCKWPMQPGEGSARSSDLTALPQLNHPSVTPSLPLKGSGAVCKSCDWNYKPRSLWGCENLAHLSIGYFFRFLKVPDAPGIIIQKINTPGIPHWTRYPRVCPDLQQRGWENDMFPAQCFTSSTCSWLYRGHTHSCV